MRVRLSDQAPRAVRPADQRVPTTPTSDEMKLKTEVLRAVQRRRRLMHEQDQVEWSYALSIVLARCPDSTPEQIAERCWLLWWPTRGDLPIDFDVVWPPICVAHAESLPRVAVGSSKSPRTAELRRALGEESASLSEQGLQVLRGELVLLARVCTQLLEDSRA